MTPELRKALNNAYRVFEPYNDEFQMARACGISRPLHALTFEDWRAMCARFDIGVLLWSDVSYRHFLPMLMEWESRNQWNRNSPAFWTADFLSRLKNFRWLQWPVEEVEAIRRILRVWVWTQEMLADPQKRMFPVLLAEILDIEDDLNPYFNLWLEKRPLEVAQWLVGQNWIQPQAVLVRWATQPLVAEKFEEGFWNNPEGTQAALFSRVLQLLDSLRA